MKRTKRTKKKRLKGKKKSSKLNNNVNNNIIETREKDSCIKCNKKISKWSDKSKIIRTCNYCLEMDNIKDLKLKQYLSKDKCDICNSSLYIYTNPNNRIHTKCLKKLLVKIDNSLKRECSHFMGSCDNDIRNICNYKYCNKNDLKRNKVPMNFCGKCYVNKKQLFNENFKDLNLFNYGKGLVWKRKQTPGNYGKFTTRGSLKSKCTQCKFNLQTNYYFHRECKEKIISKLK